MINPNQFPVLKRFFAAGTQGALDNACPELLLDSGRVILTGFIWFSHTYW